MRRNISPSFNELLRQFVYSQGMAVEYDTLLDEIIRRVDSAQEVQDAAINWFAACSTSEDLYRDMAEQVERHSFTDAESVENFAGLAREFAQKCMSADDTQDYLCQTLATWRDTRQKTSD